MIPLRLNVCVGRVTSLWYCFFLPFLNHSTFFFYQMHLPTASILTNKVSFRLAEVAFSLIPDDTVRLYEGGREREAVSNLRRIWHHQIQLGKTKQVLINTKWVIDEQCGRMCLAGACLIMYIRDGRLPNTKKKITKQYFKAQLCVRYYIFHQLVCLWLFLCEWLHLSTRG